MKEHQNCDELCTHKSLIETYSTGYTEAHTGSEITWEPCADKELDETNVSQSKESSGEVFKNGYVGKFAGYMMNGVTITPEEIEVYRAGVEEERSRILALIESKKEESRLQWIQLNNKYSKSRERGKILVLTSLAEELK